MKPGQSAGQRVLRSPIKTQLPEPRARRRLRTSYGCDLTQKFRGGGVCRGGVHVWFFLPQQVVGVPAWWADADSVPNFIVPSFLPEPSSRAPTSPGSALRETILRC